MTSSIPCWWSVSGRAVILGMVALVVLGGLAPKLQAQERGDTTQPEAEGVQPAPPDTVPTPALTPSYPSERTERDTTEPERAIVTADSLSALVRNGERLQELFGNVYVQQDTTRLRSDYALRYRDRDELLFIDNVVIYERGDTLRADTIRYDRTAEVGRARGNVRLTDGDVVVRAPRAIYYADEKRAVFPDSVVLVDSSRVLRARWGTYWSDEQRAEFGGGVRLTEPGTHIDADSLTYFRDQERSVARGNVFIERRGDETATADTTTRTYLFGNRADNRDERGYSRVEGRALLVQIRTDSTGSPEDTLAVQARRLDAFRTDTHRRLVAVDSVRIWQSDIAAVADSVVYDRVLAPVSDTTRDGPIPIDTVRAPVDTSRALAESEPSGPTTDVQEEPTADSLGQVTTAEDTTTRTPTGEGPPTPSTEPTARPDTTAAADSTARTAPYAATGRTAPAPWTTPTVQSDAALPLEEIRLYRSPVTWFEDSQVSGDSIRVRVQHRSIDTVFVRSSAFAAQRDSVVDRLQQLKAQHMTAFFRADSLRRITAWPNAEAIRFVADESDSLSGAARASGDRIVLRFRDGSVRRTSVVGGAQSTYYRTPEDIPDPFELEGLRWIPDRRPTRNWLLGTQRVRHRLDLNVPSPSRRIAEGPLLQDPVPSGQYPRPGADTARADRSGQEAPPQPDSTETIRPRTDSVATTQTRTDTTDRETAQMRQQRRRQRAQQAADDQANPAAQGAGPPARTGRQAAQSAAQSQGASNRPGAAGNESESGIDFSARDSLVFVTNSETGNHGTLFGNAQMSYQQVSLQARTIDMDLEANELRASGAPPDSASSGRATFQRGEQQSITGQTLSYNLDSGRGRIVSARTQQRDAFVDAETIKMYEDSTFFGQDGQYTTCDCPPGQTPSYSLRSSRMKWQERWVYTGPIQLYLFNIPTPLWLPFGFLPNIQGRRSGPLPPDYGQDPRKGLFLQDWGWYFAMNDYMDLQLRAGIWSKGSFELNPIFRYSKRYQYDGQFNLTYQRVRIGEPQDPTFQKSHSGELRWRHSQDLSPTARLRGNINLATSSDFSRRNSRSYEDAVSQSISSTIRYNKSWPGGGQSLNISARQHQQFQSGRVSMRLPSLQFRQANFKPFEREQRVGEERWYEKITTSYSANLNNSYTFNPRDPEDLRSRGDSTLADSIQQADIQWYEALVDRRKYQFATGDDEPFDLNAEHQIPISASFRVNRYNLSFSPRARYTSDWRISTRRRFLRRDTIQVSEDSVRVADESVERSVPGFYARHDFTTSFSSSTELYGLFPIRVGPFQGLRHRMRPSLSFSYRPNFNDPLWGRTRRLRYANGDPVLDDRTGEPLRYDILTGQTVRGSSEQRNVNFSLGNELETKHVTADSTGEMQEEKIKLLDFDLGASYNFAADSLHLSDIDFRARTRIQDFSLHTSMTFSPYLSERISDDNSTFYRVVDRYMAAKNPLTPLRLTRFRIDVSGSFQSQGGASGPLGGRGTQSRTSQPPGASGRPPASAQQRRNAQNASQQRQASASTSTSQPQGYLDRSLPWSLRFDFSYSFRKPGREVIDQSATINANIDLNLTPKWAVQARTGYDLIENELATTQINLSRDLGCWQMSFSWVPFGDYRSYSFNLQVKSGQLAQLLRLRIPNSGDSRLGGIGQRLRGTVGGVAGGQRF